MVKPRKSKGAVSKKLDPAKATIYGAIVALLSAVIVASISNVDKFRAAPPSNAQAEGIITFQDYQYNQVLGALDERAKLAEQERVAAPDSEKTELIDDYLKSNSDTKVAVTAKHNEFKDAISKGDHHKAQILKTEVNGILN